MNEEGAFHQGRGNKEMKRKHVSNASAFETCFVAAFPTSAKFPGLQQRAV